MIPYTSLRRIEKSCTAVVFVFIFVFVFVFAHSFTDQSAIQPWPQGKKNITPGERQNHSRQQECLKNIQRCTKILEHLFCIRTHQAKPAAPTTTD